MKTPMTPRFPIIICALFALLSTTGIANAEDKGDSLVARVSTLGFGLEYKHSFHEKFNGRLVMNQYDLSADETRKGNRYEGDLELSSYGIIGDWHPTGGGFRLSVGALSNGNELNVRTARDTYEFGDNMYMGNASTGAEWDSLAPYVGLGWSSQKPKGWGFDFEVGVMFQGDAMLSGRGSASAGGTTCNFSVNDKGVATTSGATCATIFPNFEDDIEAEHRELEDDLESLEVYPVVSLGVQYRF